ncbi:UTP--glucose-1-phosphate uridylyltransferase-like, partial [Mizuhopecten yessoensis]
VIYTVKTYGELQIPDPDKIKDLLNKLVVVKLNGGLGTSMGCTGPKSAISVRNELTFLDLTVQQIEYLNKTYGTDVPLVLMNSFNTDEDTQKILKKYGQVRVNIYTFHQSRYPRINRESLSPIPTNCSHDDNEGPIIYTLSFIPVNIWMIPLQGGTLVECDGKLRLLEIAQVPKEHVDEFKSVSKFKIFNTNNLWISLEAMKRVVDEKTLDMEIIVNPKTLDNGLNVIQLETAVGSAIKSFEGALGINVPRRRFLPVKTTSDLLLVMSNLYNMRTGSLEMNPKRCFPSVPLVKLGSHFSKVKDFLYRFSNIPDMLELDHLTVSGDVTFGKNVTLKGTVIIIANHGERIDIPSGSVLENKIVSGNLRILDH